MPTFKLEDMEEETPYGGDNDMYFRQWRIPSMKPVLDEKLDRDFREAVARKEDYQQKKAERKQKHSEKYDRKFADLMKKMSEASVQEKKENEPFLKRFGEDERRIARERLELEFSSPSSTAKMAVAPAKPFMARPIPRQNPIFGEAMSSLKSIAIPSTSSKPSESSTPSFSTHDTVFYPQTHDSFNLDHYNGSRPSFAFTGIQGATSTPVSKKNFPIFSEIIEETGNDSVFEASKYVTALESPAREENTLRNEEKSHFYVDLPKNAAVWRHNVPDNVQAPPTEVSTLKIEEKSTKLTQGTRIQGFSVPKPENIGFFNSGSPKFTPEAQGPAQAPPTDSGTLKSGNIGFFNSGPSKSSIFGEKSNSETQKPIFSAPKPENIGFFNSGPPKLTPGAQGPAQAPPTDSGTLKSENPSIFGQKPSFSAPKPENIGFFNSGPPKLTPEAQGPAQTPPTDSGTLKLENSSMFSQKSNFSAPKPENIGFFNSGPSKLTPGAQGPAQAPPTDSGIQKSGNIGFFNTGPSKSSIIDSGTQKSIFSAPKSEDPAQAPPTFAQKSYFSAPKPENIGFFNSGPPKLIPEAQGPAQTPPTESLAQKSQDPSQAPPTSSLNPPKSQIPAPRILRAPPTMTTPPLDEAPGPRQPSQPFKLFKNYINLLETLLKEKRDYESASDPHFRSLLKRTITEKVTVFTHRQTTSDSRSEILEFFKKMLQKTPVDGFTMEATIPKLELRNEEDVNYAIFCIVEKYISLAELDDDLADSIAGVIARLTLAVRRVEKVFIVLILNKSTILRQNPEECREKFGKRKSEIAKELAENPESHEFLKNSDEKAIESNREKALVTLFFAVFTINAQYSSRGMKMVLSDQLLWKYTESTVSHGLAVPRAPLILLTLIATCKPRLFVDQDRWWDLLETIEYDMVPMMKEDPFDGDEPIISQLEHMIQRLTQN